MSIITKVNCVYFSASGTTKRVVDAIVAGCVVEQVSRYNIAKQISTIIVPNNQLTIFAMPVFAGRVPQFVAKALMEIKGNNSPAVVVVVYGNREFDDALLELKDIVESNGFNVISAAAFVAQHSMFPKVGAGRPNCEDLDIANKFGRDSIKIANSKEFIAVKVKGNNPYRPITDIPIKPKTLFKCNKCGVCAEACPVGAIDRLNPKKIDKSKCITCTQCIAICPKGAKRLSGLLYWGVNRKFVKSYRAYKEPYIVLPY